MSPVVSSRTRERERVIETNLKQIKKEMESEQGGNKNRSYRLAKDKLYKTPEGGSKFIFGSILLIHNLYFNSPEISKFFLRNK